MANAKICDRCGKVYSDNSAESEYHVFDVGLTDALSAGSYHGIRVGAMMDLCDRCAVSLAAWVIRGKREEHGDA